MTNQIGLYAMKGKLLADFMIFYQNKSSLHWNIKGDKFFELHLKFEELYTCLLLKVDEVAERIFTLGAIPLHTFGHYRQSANISSLKMFQTEYKAFEGFPNSSKPSLFIKENYYVFQVMRG
jgi:starvation-inducible DNA-binding protein